MDARRLVLLLMAGVSIMMAGCLEVNESAEPNDDETEVDVDADESRQGDGDGDARLVCEGQTQEQNDDQVTGSGTCELQD